MLCTVNALVLQNLTTFFYFMFYEYHGYIILQNLLWICVGWHGKLEGCDSFLDFHTFF